MTTYLHPDLLARAQALGLKARAVVEGLRVGDHRSPFRGYSVEFVQHREYVPGDDIRHIDWKGYGRSERYTIKQYEQETNYAGHILLDASRSMLYGDKLEFAKLLAATLSYVIIHQRDSAALWVFDEHWRTRLPASGQPGHVQTILETLESTEPREPSSIGPLLHDLAGQLRRRGLVFLISDCFDEVANLLGGLQHLRFQGHEVMLFHVMHPDEIEFPFEGMVKFDGLELPQRVLTRPQLIRPAYRKVVERYLSELRKGCDANRCDYVMLDPTKPLAGPLSEYLARRMKVKK